MFDLWCILEINTGNNNLSVKQIVKFLRNYILPTIITAIIVSKINKNINFHINDTIINLAIINAFYASSIHFYIQKKFFTRLDSDVIIKFIPNKTSNYIILRLFMIFTKVYLPVIIPSILTLGIFFVNSKPIFYVCSALFIVATIIINVLLSLFLRYFTNTAKIVYVKISNFLFSIFIFVLFLLTSFYTPIWILSNVEASLKHPNIRSIIEINGLALLLFILIAIFVLVTFKYSIDYLNVRARRLIFNRQFPISINERIVEKKIERLYKRVYSIHLSTLEKNIFNKDVKEIIRESKYSFLFVVINQILNISIVLFFNFSERTNTVEGSIIMSKLITVIVIGQMLIAVFISKATFEKHINIENDFDILGKYNIKFTKNNVIKAKIRLLSTIVFPKIYLIFSILIVVSIIRLNSFLALIYLLSMLQIIFIKKTMELWRVKSINGLNSKSEVIKPLNVLGMFGIIFCYVYIYNMNLDKLNYIHGQLILIFLTAIVYIFHSLVNNSKGVEGKEC